MFVVLVCLVLLRGGASAAPATSAHPDRSTAHCGASSRTGPGVGVLESVATALEPPETSGSRFPTFIFSAASSTL